MWWPSLTTAKGSRTQETMRQAMLRAKALGKLPAVAHCEDESLVGGGYIHDGAYARAHGHRGNPSASEWKQVERDLKLVEETGCAYHVCHVSTKESVELIRQAKARGLDVTCETAPHYLVFNDTMLQEEGRFKINPPIRSEADRQALLAGIPDGTVDPVATDHAPHTAEEKAGGLEKSLPNGIVGLETAFPVLYTQLVRPGSSLAQLVSISCTPTPPSALAWAAAWKWARRRTSRSLTWTPATPCVRRTSSPRGRARPLPAKRSMASAC